MVYLREQSGLSDLYYYSRVIATEKYNFYCDSFTFASGFCFRFGGRFVLRLLGIYVAAVRDSGINNVPTYDEDLLDFELL